MSFAHLRAVAAVVVTEKGFIAHPWLRGQGGIWVSLNTSVFLTMQMPLSLNSLESRKGSSSHNGIAGIRPLLPRKTTGKNVEQLCAGIGQQLTQDNGP